MKGNPNVVGETKAFDWTVIDNALSGSASRNMHVAWRIIVDFPSWRLMVPQYLLDGGLDMRTYDGGVSPYYGDPKLVEAFEQLITRLGKRYDGDKRLGYIQVGLLGFWGEWHTWGGDFIPDGVGTKVMGWFIKAFTKTQVQTRYPDAAGYKAGFGRHDDSFGYETLDGPDNGGQVRDYYFWPDVMKRNQSDFWKKGAMGGETRGEVASQIFEPGYPAGTFQRQVSGGCMTCKCTKRRGRELRLTVESLRDRVS
jgi:hypothetical protein